jgi:NDP-sugar pyrophosphorylase family protein
MNADLMNAVDFAAMLELHMHAQAHATVAAFEHVTEVPFGVMVTSGSQLLRIEEKPVRRDLVNAGVYVLEPSTMRHIPPGARTDMPAVLAAILASGGSVHIHKIDGYWLDIGTPASLARAQVDHDLT